MKEKESSFGDVDKLKWEAILIENQILWQYPGHGPHATYTLSEKHSDFYFNSDYLISNPPLLKEAAVALLHKVQPQLKTQPKWIVTYPPYGLNIGFSLAELFDCKFAYIKSLEQPELNFDISPEDTVLFCADDLQTGSSFRQVRSALDQTGAKINAPLVVVANLSGNAVFDGFEVVSLFQKDIHIWDAGDCPLCAAGSEALPARRNWQEFVNGV